GSFMLVNTSGRFAGQKAHLLLPHLKENDTHCIDFHYYVSSKSGSSPGTLNIYVKVNDGPLGNPVWNTSLTAAWNRAELAISTFWPNFYQVVFEVVTSGHPGYVAIDEVKVLGHPCTKTPHFLRLQSVEVNAGQFATFQCTANGGTDSSDRLWLQVISVFPNALRPLGVMEFIALKGIPPPALPKYILSSVGSNLRGLLGFFYLKPCCEFPGHRDAPAPQHLPSLRWTLSSSSLSLLAWGAQNWTQDGRCFATERTTKIVSSRRHLTVELGFIGYVKFTDLDNLLLMLLTIILWIKKHTKNSVGNFADPMRGPRKLEVVEIKSRQITICWEPFGYNVTRCHRYNLTVHYRYQAGGQEQVREEVSWDTESSHPQHTITNLSPYTNVSIKLVLMNPEGRKESQELVVQTDEDVPSAVPLESIQGSTFEEKIFLQWREPAQTYGVITLYEV
ncbi:PTPRT phosphatase, partial [Halcyon senegalensis]|nr:PTPRT phosphatase [Halcyon senegalensis]